MCFGIGVKIPSKAYFLFFGSFLFLNFAVCKSMLFPFFFQRAEVLPHLFLASAEDMTGGMPGGETGTENDMFQEKLSE